MARTKFSAAGRWAGGIFFVPSRGRKKASPVRMIARILPLLALLLLLPAWAVDRRELRPRRVRGRVRWCLWLPVLVLLALLSATAFRESYTPQADLWKGRLLTLTLLSGVPLTVYALLLPLRRRAVRLVAALGVLLVLLYGFTLGWRRLEVRRIDVACATLPPAFDGYRIVHLSDLHLGTLRGHAGVVARLVDSVNAQHPDLIALTGDLVNYHPEEFLEFVPQLRRLRARDGIVSVMGNHDYMGYHRWPGTADSLAAVRRLQDTQRTMGWHLLLNDNHLVRRGADSIAVIGLENDGPPRFPALADLTKARHGLAPGCFEVCLQHDPSYWRRMSPPAPLMLAGHTHGMQLRLLGWSPAAWFYPEWGGLYERSASPSAVPARLYVSQGFGSVLLPFRLGAWPELTVITLRTR